jgi:hypothetical protein
MTDEEIVDLISRKHGALKNHLLVELSKIEKDIWAAYRRIDYALEKCDKLIKRYEKVNPEISFREKLSADLFKEVEKSVKEKVTQFINEIGNLPEYRDLANIINNHANAYERLVYAYNELLKEVSELKNDR